MSPKHYDVKNFTSARSVGYLLKMSHSLMHAAGAAAFAGHELSFMQWLALLKLREGTALTASSLCRLMHHDTGALTRLVDQLEERGLVVRKRSDEDRRVVMLELTEAGHRKVDELLPLAVDSLNTTLADFSKAEFAELTRLLNKLIDGLRAYQQPPGSGEPS
jgi:DNA-binding MarR family transcriptional regulator